MIKNLKVKDLQLFINQIIIYLQSIFSNILVLTHGIT